MKLGRKTYQVIYMLNFPYDAQIDHSRSIIRIREGLKPAEEAEAFWHEIVHGILRDMRRHDVNTERFVNAFCKRLYQVLESLDELKY